MRRIKLSDHERAVIAEMVDDLFAPKEQPPPVGWRRESRSLITQAVHAVEDTINRRAFRASLGSKQSVAEHDFAPPAD